MNFAATRSGDMVERSTSTISTGARSGSSLPGLGGGLRQVAEEVGGEDQVPAPERLHFAWALGLLVLDEAEHRRAGTGAAVVCCAGTSATVGAAAGRHRASTGEAAPMGTSGAIPLPSGVENIRPRPDARI
ncbi:hypothetical protein [Kitasatospora sp. McL0602]|uniref:hypothetical protein n=1 Tax=Kitasatospora sp. McL0602 TaxID=3439530 RepID=UPI003F8C5A7A